MSRSLATKKRRHSLKKLCSYWTERPWRRALLRMSMPVAGIPKRHARSFRTWLSKLKRDMWTNTQSDLCTLLWACTKQLWIGSKEQLKSDAPGSASSRWEIQDWTGFAQIRDLKGCWD